MRGRHQWARSCSGRQSEMLSTKSALFRHGQRRCPKLHRSTPASPTLPTPCVPGAAATRPVPLVPKSVRDLSAHAPASDSRDFRRLPAAHILPPPAAASAHPDTDLSWLLLQRSRESDAKSVVARAAFRRAPYPAHGWPASRGIRPSILLRVTLNLLQDALSRSGPGNWHSVFSDARSFYR